MLTSYHDQNVNKRFETVSYLYIYAGVFNLKIDHKKYTADKLSDSPSKSIYGSVHVISFSTS